MPEINTDRIRFIEEFKARTKKFALRIIKLYQSLPSSGASQIIGKQILRSGTSVAANYRAACRARSNAEFVSKIGIVVEEADETVFWMELLIDSKLIKKEKLDPLFKEANEILAVVSSARKNAKRNKK
jgi:four helix bundle protein